MAGDVGTKLQTEVGALLGVVFALALPVLALVWGRAPGLRTEKAAGAGGFLARDAAARPEGSLPRGVAPPLSAGDKEYLMGLLLDCVQSFRTGEAGGQEGPCCPEDSGETPPACRFGDGAMVFVTVFTAGTSPVRAQAAGPSLAESVRQAARTLVGRADFRGRDLGPDGASRVRIDVVTRCRHLSPEERRAFASFDLDEPVGAALAVRGQPGFHFFLPADHAVRDGSTRRRMLAELCEEAGREGGFWRSPQSEVYRLEAVAFVNQAPGGRRCVDVPRGVPVGEEVTADVLLHACRAAAGWLVRNQAAAGWFVAGFDAARGMAAWRLDLPAQFEAVSALAALQSVEPTEELSGACDRALVAALAMLDVPSGGGENVPVSPDLHAAALRALCEYRRASGDKSRDELIMRLADALATYQAEEAALARRLEELSGGAALGHQGPGRHAGMALALAAAYRELKQQAHLAAAGMTLGPAADGGGGLDFLREPLAAAGAAEVLAASRRQKFCNTAATAAGALLASQLRQDDGPGPDLVGVIVPPFPAPVRRLAEHVRALTACREMAGEADGAYVAAAMRAAQCLVQFQFTPGNSYYLRKPARAAGAFRVSQGSNRTDLRTMSAAIEGLLSLARVKLSADRRG